MVSLMKHFYLASLLTCAVALAGCGGGSSSPMPTTPTPTPPPGGATPTTVSIPMGAASLTAAYVPDSIKVPIGGTVNWTNNDVIAHNVNSTTNVFSSPIMEAGATFSQTFMTAGTFPYYCTLHVGMTGTVTVQ